MMPEKILAWGRNRSCIRELAEYGARRKQEIGAENVYDFSLGNPSIPSPPCVNETVLELIQSGDPTLHAYTTAAGRLSLRQAIADDMHRRGVDCIAPELIYVTCGAASALASTLRAVLLPGDEVMVMAPFFPDYRVFSEACSASLAIVPPGKDFQIDVDAVAAKLSVRTRAVILNSPNNPSGVVYSEETLKALAEVLVRAQHIYGRHIYLISDEPYRDLVYDIERTPTALNYYNNAIQCYSWSKALSLPGERIGYVAVSTRMKNGANVYAGIMGAARSYGYVNPPSLFQRVMERCVSETVDITPYRENRDLLCGGLREIGYEFCPPQGAFYLFVKTLEPDAKAFSERAKQHELLLVPGDDFGCGGYVRIAYCVSKDMIRRSLPAFRALYEEYQK